MHHRVRILFKLKFIVMNISAGMAYTEAKIRRARSVSKYVENVSKKSIEN